MRIRIGPFLIEVTGDAVTLESLAAPFEHYLVDDSSSPSLEVALHRAPPSTLPSTPGSLRTDERTFSVTYRPGSAQAHHLAPETNAVEMPLNVAFMHALSLHAIDQGALLTHAAAVAPAGRGLVFVGRSGAGKSTLASWFDPEDVLNDDFVLLHRDQDGTALVSSQPFFGKSMADRVGTPSTARVERLLTLRHATQTQLSGLTPSDALRALMTSVAVPSNVASRQKRVLDIAAQWSQERWFRLDFPLDSTSTLRALRDRTAD